MRPRLQARAYFIIIFAALELASCGKKKPGQVSNPNNPSQIPSDWDLKSDYPATDLKAKDL